MRKNDHDNPISSIGHVHDEPGEIVIRVLFSDEDSFCAYLHQLAEDPWAARFLQHVEGEIGWETIEVDQVERETLPARHASGFTNALPGRS